MQLLPPSLLTSFSPWHVRTNPLSRPLAIFGRYDYIILSQPLHERDAELLEELRHTFRAFVREHYPEVPASKLLCPPPNSSAPSISSAPPPTRLDPLSRRFPPHPTPFDWCRHEPSFPILCPWPVPIGDTSCATSCFVLATHPRCASPTLSRSPPRTTLASYRSTSTATTSTPICRRLRRSSLP